MSAWLLGGALLLGIIVGLMLEARNSINQVTRDRLGDAEADDAFRRRVVYEMDRYNEESSRPE